MIKGFGPVFDDKSRFLVLGSFPSVKSREINFYYGNKHNRFWGVISKIFNENTPESTKEKISFLKRNNIALWDVVDECEVVGSADSSIKNYKVSDLSVIFSVAKIEKVLLNGALAAKIYEKNFGALPYPYIKLPSTSPANATFKEEKWLAAFDFCRR